MLFPSCDLLQKRRRKRRRGVAGRRGLLDERLSPPPASTEFPLMCRTKTSELLEGNKWHQVLEQILPVFLSAPDVWAIHGLEIFFFFTVRLIGGQNCSKEMSLGAFVLKRQLVQKHLIVGAGLNKVKQFFFFF